MKKIISVILAVMLMLTANISFAYSEPESISEPPTFFPETYLGSLSRTFTRGLTLEDILVRGWKNLDASIDISSFNLTPEEFTVEYRGIWSEHPECYYLTNGFGGTASGSTHKMLTVEPDYTETDKEKISEMLAQIETATDEILLLINDDMTDFEKVMTVHNYMVLEYEYDKDNPNYDATIMVTKTGVCQAYAFAFKLMMNELEIPCVFVPAYEMLPDPHGWNLVNIDGNWYHIDLTWDDLSDDQYGRVSNKNALLSDSGIQATEHYAYDTKGLTADSTLYDKAEWHNSDSEVVSIHGTSYWASGDSIVSSKGDVIFSGLDEGSTGWSTGSGNPRFGGVYTGLAVHNDILYFNSDCAIYSYNPKKDKVPVQLKAIDGVCGLFIHNNMLKYNKCEPEKVYDNEEGDFSGKYSLHFRPNGEIKLADTRFGCPRYEDGKIVVRVYKEDNAPLCIYSSGDTIGVKTVKSSKISKVEFNAEDEQTIFFWNENMQPLTEKKVHKNK